MENIAMSSFKYYEDVIRHNRKGDRDEKFIDGIRAVISAYWELTRAGKLPPLSVDDRDEALDRVMANLSQTLRRYDPARGATITTYVHSVMRFAWLDAAHAVAKEAARYETGVFLDNEEVEDAVGSEDGSSADYEALVYASAPLGLGDPAAEAMNAEHVRMLEELADGKLSPAHYRSRVKTTRTRADSRRRYLRGESSSAEDAA